MGRRKFSYKGKPHGRNELITEYLWLAYLQSLAPGQRPDPSMARSRKQVSSHIQVLKGFLKDHPACKIFFLPDIRRMLLTHPSRATIPTETGSQEWI